MGARNWLRREWAEDEEDIAILRGPWRSEVDDEQDGDEK